MDPADEYGVLNQTKPKEESEYGVLEKPKKSTKPSAESRKNIEGLLTSLDMPVTRAKVDSIQSKLTSKEMNTPVPIIPRLEDEYGVLAEPKKDDAFFEKFKKEMSTMSNQEVIKRLIDGMMASVDFPNSEKSMSQDQIQSIQTSLMSRGITLSDVFANMEKTDKEKLKNNMNKKAQNDFTHGIAIINTNGTNIATKKQDQLSAYIKETLSKPSCGVFVPSSGSMKDMKLVYWYDSASTNKISKEWKCISGMDVPYPIIITYKGGRLSNKKIKSYM